VGKIPLGGTDKDTRGSVNFFCLKTPITGLQLFVVACLFKSNFCDQKILPEQWILQPPKKSARLLFSRLRKGKD